MATDAKIPVWLDCDPGHDDAFAILLAAYHPSMDLLGISTVHGNASLVNTTRNAGSILTAIGKPDIPVYSGAAKGLIRPAVHADAIHGESGLDGTHLLPTPLTPPKTEPCIPAIAAALSKTQPGTAWVVATGALTNIAMLFQEHPELASHIAGLSIMGGAIGSTFTNAPMGVVNDTSRIGNYTPYAEFNILVDPEAASFLLSHPILSLKTTLIPLDVTHLVLATEDVQRLLTFGKEGSGSGSGSESTEELVGEGKKECSTLRKMLLELLLFFAKTYAEVFGITAGPPLHDPLAVAAILDSLLPSTSTSTASSIPTPLFQDYLPIVTQSLSREYVRRERYKVEVITEGTHAEALAGKMQTGRTVATLLKEGEEGVRIPRGVDVERFWGLIEDCLGRADEVNAGRGKEAV